jgi:hypothetical protein
MVGDWDGYRASSDLLLHQEMTAALADKNETFGLHKPTDFLSRKYTELRHKRLQIG